MAASNRCQAKGHVGEKQEYIIALNNAIFVFNADFS